MNLLTDLLAGAERHAARVAIVDAKGRSFTYRDLLDASAALSSAWAAGGPASRGPVVGDRFPGDRVAGDPVAGDLVAGDRVLVCMKVGFGLYAALIALWRLGAVAVFPEPALGLFGLRHAAATTTPKAYLADGWYRFLKPFLPELRRIRLTLPASAPASGTPSSPPADLAPDAPALISFTSGSTGKPKAIVRSHRLLAAQNNAVARFLRPPGGPTVDLVAFPVFVLAELGLGNTAVLPDWKLSRPDSVTPARLARLIAARFIERALVPPALLPQLVASPEPRLDAIFTGGGPVFPDMLERLAAARPATAVTAVYGSTEAEPIAHLTSAEIAPGDWRAMRQGQGILAGVPAPEAKVAILDGEILVTGEHVNKAYLDPAHDAGTKLRRDGAIWHRTGDAGHLDEHGRLWLLGRLAGRAGGLFPFAVEVAARSWPGVAAAALVDHHGRAILAIEGDAAHEPDWRAAAARLGPLTVRHVARMPLDRRHRSKIDYVALRRLL